MKRANWIYLVATLVVLSTGVSVAGAKSKHHDRLAASGDGFTTDQRWEGRWSHGLATSTTTGNVSSTTDSTTTTSTTQPPTTTLDTTTTQAPPTVPTPTTIGTPPPPPPQPDTAARRGAFLSYPHEASTLTINGGTNVEVSGKTFQGFTGKTALVVSGAHNVYLHNLDFADNGGDIFLVNCTGQIRVEDIRARNTGDGTIGSGHGNVIQLNNTWDDGTGGIRRVDALGGDTEDMISIFKSGGVDASHPLVIEDNHLESPLPSSPLAWSSGSGTGINLADYGGHDIILRNNTLLNVGQVGIQLNQPVRVTVTNNIVYGAARANSNVGISQWNGSACGTCVGNSITNNRIWWAKANGSASAMWLSGTAAVSTSGNTLQDTSIDPASLHVVL